MPLSPHIRRVCLTLAWLAPVSQGVLLVLPQATVQARAHTSVETWHLLMELVSVLIAAMVAIVSWHAFRDRADRRLPILSAGFMVVAVCDLMHALTYEGMPQMLGPTGTSRAIFFWLMGRTVEVSTLALMTLPRLPALPRWGSLAVGGLLSSGLIAWGSWGLEAFPVTFVEGQGVTPFKASYEGLLCLANGVVAWRLWQRFRVTGRPHLLLLAASAWVIGIGGLSFTSYVTPSDVQNMAGHLYKLVGYALLYWATYVTGLRAPYEAARAAEQRAHDSEQLIRALSNDLPGAIVYQLIREPNGARHFAYVSDTVESLMGVPAQALMQDASALYGRVHPDDQAALMAAKQACEQALTVLDVTVRMRRSDGEMRWMHLMSRPRALPGERVCWDGLLLDVTDSREAAQTLRESEAMLAAVIDSASDAILICDAQERVRLFNPAAEQIFGYAAKDMRGASVSRLLPAGLQSAQDRARASAEAPGSAARRLGLGRVQGVHADGSTRELEASVSHVAVHGQQMLTAILRDVTDRVRTERALWQYQLELTELTHQLMAQEKATSSRLALILHDQLGQTLSAMRIDYVSDARFADPADAARHARVDGLIDQAIQDVRQLLVELRPTLLDEHGLIAALDNELLSRRPASGPVSLRLESAPALQARRWPGDVEYAVFMVAREALANALNHAQASEICVRLEGDTHWLRLEVQDNGQGLAPGALTVRPGHLGMVGMRERAIAIGAVFEVGEAPGGGTLITLNWEDGSP